MVMPGDNIRCRQLIAPIAMDEGLRFAIREGGRTVGAGVVAKSSSEYLSKRRVESRLFLFRESQCKARKFASVSRPTITS
jgi:hypothetical protein